MWSYLAVKQIWRMLCLGLQGVPSSSARLPRKFIHLKLKNRPARQTNSILPVPETDYTVWRFSGKRTKLWRRYINRNLMNFDGDVFQVHPEIKSFKKNILVLSKNFFIKVT